MIDDIDLQILRAIQNNARITTAALAEKVQISHTRCWKRVRALEANGVIQQYVAVINQRALGYTSVALIDIRLKRNDEEAIREFEAALVNLPQVAETLRTTGDFDYLIKISITGLDDCERLFKEHIHPLPWIHTTQLRFVLKTLAGIGPVQRAPKRAAKIRQPLCVGRKRSNTRYISPSTQATSAVVHKTAPQRNRTTSPPTAQRR